MEEKIPQLFIGAAGRSGTTLLADLLGLHPELSPVYETDFVFKLVELFYSTKYDNYTFEDKKEIYANFMNKWSESLPIKPHNKRKHEKYVHGPHYIKFSKNYLRKLTKDLLKFLSKSNLNNLIPKYLKKLFDKHAHLDNKNYWINKTPIYVLCPEVLLSWFPKMKFIHIIRDGRDVALSVLTRPWGPNNFEAAADWWSANVRSGREFGKKYPEHYIEIKFENLINNTSDSLQYIFEKTCRNTFTKDMITNIINKSYSINAEMTNKWKKYKNKSDLKLFLNKSKELMLDLNYY